LQVGLGPQYYELGINAINQVEDGEGKSLTNIHIPSIKMLQKNYIVFICIITPKGPSDHSTYTRNLR